MQLLHSTVCHITAGLIRNMSPWIHTAVCSMPGEAGNRKQVTVQPNLLTYPNCLKSKASFTFQASLNNFIFMLRLDLSILTVHICDHTWRISMNNLDKPVTWSALHSHTDFLANCFELDTVSLSFFQFCLNRFPKYWVNHQFLHSSMNIVTTVTVLYCIATWFLTCPF